MKTTEMNYTPIQLKLPVDMERIIEMVLVKISGLDRQNAKKPVGSACEYTLLQGFRPRIAQALCVYYPIFRTKSKIFTNTKMLNMAGILENHWYFVVV